MNLLDYAINELKIAGLDDPKDESQQLINKNILDIIKVFAAQCHSGSSANYVICTVEQLLRFKPLGALKGTEDEWIPRGGGLFQNKRCSSVFKDKDGAYDINGYYFQNQRGTTFTNNYTHKSIDFPYIPEPPKGILIHEPAELRDEKT